jgi:chromosome partitioning protein
VGAQLVNLEALERDNRLAWKQLLRDAAERADVVIIDTPAGMGGTTRQVLAGCTHVLGVLQAESIAQRSFERFHQSLQQLASTNVAVLGVVLNMLQMRHPGSLSVFHAACQEQLGRWLFETTIPRHQSFLDAALEGLPLRPLDEQAPGAVGFLFDNLASEVAERLALPVVKRKQRGLLL